LINTSVDSVFHVSFDGHPFTVITADFVSTLVAPNEIGLALILSGTDQIIHRNASDFEHRYVLSATCMFACRGQYIPDKSRPNNPSGQRYDVIINANQTVGNYWARVSIGTDCGDNSILEDNIPLGAILHYEGADNAEPTGTGETMRTHCLDETNLVPFVPNTVPSSIVAQDELALNHVQDESTENLFRWTIDGSTQIVNWTQPSLKTALENGPDFGNNSNIYEIPTRDNVSSAILTLHADS
jgi:hypothetical protein